MPCLSRADYIVPDPADLAGETALLFPEPRGAERLMGMVRSRPRLRSFLSAIIAFVVLSPPLAFAADQQFGAFLVRDSAPDVIELAGPLDTGSDHDFAEAMGAAPGAKLLVINSEGMSTRAALNVAHAVHDAGLETFIPQGARCHGACALVFLAGRNRDAEGELGVRRLGNNDGVGAVEILDTLVDFDTPAPVLTRIIGNGSDEFHIFSGTEIARLGLLASSDTDKYRAGTADSDHIFDDLIQSASPRMAIYVGVDFYGNDFASIHASNAARCAQTCVSTRTCRAFTFNTATNVRKGPNCFLKSDRSFADGNSVAISGELLAGSEPDPDPIRIGAIDPTQSVTKDFDFPGGDVSQTPYYGAGTAESCRIACVREERCKAFTFAASNRTCWLKSSILGGRYADGMISGRKDYRVIRPAKIIPVD